MASPVSPRLASGFRLAVLVCVTAAGLRAEDPDPVTQAKAAEQAHQPAEAARYYEMAAIQRAAAHDVGREQFYYRLAAYSARNANLIRDVERLSRAGIDAGRRLGTDDPNSRCPNYLRLTQVDLLGYLASALGDQFQYGGMSVTLAEVVQQLERFQIQESGRALGVEDWTRAAEWRPNARAAVLRSLLVKAQLLNLAGRVPDAVALLRRTDDTHSALLGSGQPSYYLGKIRAELANDLLFLGYEQEALALYAKVVTEQDAQNTSHWIQVINYERARSRVEGPSEPSLARARHAAAEVARLKGLPRDPGCERVLVKMENDLAEADTLPDDQTDAARRIRTAAALRRIGDAGNSGGNVAHAFLSSRDAVLYDDDSRDLEPEFLQLLQTARGSGRLVSEPLIYEAYGSWLVGHGRGREGMTLLGTALQLTRAWGWTRHIPGRLVSMLEACLLLGDAAGARSMAAALEAELQRQPDLPPRRKMRGLGALAAFCFWCGDDATGRARLEQLRQLAAGQNLSKREAQELSQLTGSGLIRRFPPYGEGLPGIAVDLQPLTTITEAPAGTRVEGWFTLSNLSSHPARGRLLFTGAVTNAVWNAEQLEWCLALGAAGEGGARGQEVSLDVGDQAVIRVEARMPESRPAVDAVLEWQMTGATHRAVWQLRPTRDEGSGEVRVLEAHLAEWSPAYVLPLRHHFLVPADPLIPVAFRVRASSPVRLEYWNAAGTIPLAVDAQGNGEFTDRGDLLAPGTAGTNAVPVLPVDTAGGAVVELRVFPAAGATTNRLAELTLDVELMTSNRWECAARDILKFKAP